MTHPKVRRMREKLGELLGLALEAEDERSAERILHIYERGEITRQEAISMLKKPRNKKQSKTRNKL